MVTSEAPSTTRRRALESDASRRRRSAHSVSRKGKAGGLPRNSVSGLSQDGAERLDLGG